MDHIADRLAKELGQRKEYVENVIRLLDEGNTIPFIARYRKEMHGAMDDTSLRALETRLTYLRGLQERKDEVLRLIEEQGKLTPQLQKQIEEALSSGAISVDEITRLSKRLPLLDDELDVKSMRWLELSEIADNKS